MKKPKCITCGKTLKRKTTSVLMAKEPYKGNLICLQSKQQVVDGWTSSQFKKGDIMYSYKLWDGESYYYYLGRYRFCGVNCTAKYGIRHLPKRELRKL